ncbi:zinc-binding dehydrogenase [Paenibacillus suaedae]|uniref:zinc-binding dehydrogenase n=1 Tax=Paenibacillus suaedae TaxID=3077233 RepID=UPI0037424948
MTRVVASDSGNVFNVCSGQWIRYAFTIIQASGALHVLDHITEAFMDKIMSLTHERGSDVIIEFLANVNLETDLEIIAPYGRIGVVGNRGSLERSYYPLIKDQIIRREGRLPTNRKELFPAAGNAKKKKRRKMSN